MPLLTNDDWRGLFCRHLSKACDDESFALHALVIMPEHVHLLVGPLADSARIGRFLARVKQSTSKEIKSRLIESRSALIEQLTVTTKGKATFRFWQAGGGYDRNLFTPQAIVVSIDYLHANPVRRGLCHRPTEWKWSSACWYADGTIDPDLPPITRLDSEWLEDARATSIG